MDASLNILLILFCVAVVAGCIDTLSGGGGLITIPSLLLCGIPPLFALGTNKLQGVAGTATATYLFTKSHSIEWSTLKPLVIYAFIGATIGTVLIQFVDAQALSFVIPCVLAFIALYFLFSPFLNIKEGTAKLSEKKYCLFIMPAIGFYDGMFGPGAGSFFTLAGVTLQGKGLVESTILAKPLNLVTNLASLFVFIFSGHILWKIGCVMMIGQFFGARIGALLLFKINKDILRYIVVFICVCMLIKFYMLRA